MSASSSSHVEPKPVSLRAPGVVSAPLTERQSDLKATAVFVCNEGSSTTSPTSHSPPPLPIPGSNFFSRLAHMTSATAPIPYKLFFMLAYGVASVAIMLVVKTVLTEYDFRSFQFVAMLQYLCAALIQLLQRNVTHTVPNFPLGNFWHNMIVVLFPTPMLFVANTLSGIGASRDLSMPTFVMIRRVAIALTMFLEWFILRKKPTRMVMVSVGLMILAAVVGSGFEMKGSLRGMVMVHVNNLLTALQSVFLRKKIDEVAHVLTSDGILFYNNMFAFMVSAIPFVFNIGGERDVVLAYDGWSNPKFLFALFMSSIMGFLLSYSTLMCTKLNSPLTTAMVGAAKNTVTSYIGMLFKDYVFGWWNFVGVNIGVVGTILYSKVQVDRLRAESATAKTAAVTLGAEKQAARND